MNPRIPFVAIFAVCAGLLGFGYYLEYVQGLIPCPMCILQRWCYMAVGLVAALAAAHNPARVGHVIYGLLMALSGAVGAAIAGRQTWLQHLPADRVPECGPDLAFMLQVFPLGEALMMAIKGSGDCAEVDWRFVGLSIAEWSLIWFAVLILAALYLMFRGGRTASPGTAAAQ